MEEMEHYFNQMQPVILNEHNMDTLNPLLNQFIHEVKGEIEAWSERGSGWIMDKILKAFINVGAIPANARRKLHGTADKAEKQESGSQHTKQKRQ